MYYKIGTLAKRFNITTQAIRYYEKQGFLVSSRENGSTTRRYQTRNLKWLSSIRRYHNMGFGIDEIKQIFKCDSPTQLKKLISDKERQTVKIIEDESKRLEALRQQLSDIDRIETLLNKCQVEPSPTLWMLIDQEGQKLNETESVERVLCDWIKELAFIHSAVTVTPEAIVSKDKYAGRRSGFCVEETVAQRLGLPFCNGILKFYHEKCIHTVIVRAKGPSQIQYVIDYAKENNLQFTSDAIGRCLVKTEEERCREDGIVPRALYYEYWFPVCELM